MAEITEERLMMLLGSARQNRAECVEQIHNYDGAIQVLTLLLDDLRAQDIAEQAGKDYGELVDNREAESPPASQPEEAQ